MSRQGRYGEARFAAMCQAPDARADAVLNKATDDMHGWDHFVEIELDKQSDLPADLQNNLIQCFAQIKTTGGTLPKTRVKLSNAIKASNSSLPSFLFLYHQEKGSEDAALYGTHIWDHEISRTLKRARETEISGNRILNKQYIHYQFCEDDLITENPVDWMLRKIESVDANSYSERKSRLAASVGYGEHKIEGDIFFGPLKSIGDVVMHQIGLAEDLPVKSLTLFDKRFDIRSRNPVEEFGEGRIKINVTPRPVTLLVSSTSGRSFEMPAQALAPNIVPYDHPDFRTHVKAGQISIVVSPHTASQKFDISFNTVDPHSLLQQTGLLCFFNWSENSHVEFQVKVDAGKLFRGKIKTVEKAENWMKALEDLGHYLIEVIGREICKNISVSLKDMHETQCTSKFAASIHSAGTIRFQANFENDIDKFDKLIAFNYGKIGEWSFGSIWEMDLQLREVDQSITSFYFHKPKITKKFAFKQPLDEFRETMAAEFSEFRSTFTNPVAVIQDGDLSEFNKAITDKKPIFFSVD